MPSVYIQDLGAKLQKLYASRRNPEIAKHEDLAGKLGLKSRASVANWINGNTTTRECSVPEKHLTPLHRIFLIDRRVFVDTDIRQFEEYLNCPGSSWQSLMNLAATYTERAVQLILERPEGILLDDTAASSQPALRGIGGIDGDEQGGPKLSLGQRFRLALSGPSGWSFLILFEAPDGLHYLRPTPKDRDNVFGQTNPHVTVPAADRQALYATVPTGRHSLLVVLSREQWPEEVYAALWDTERLGYAIDHVFATLKGLQEDDWSLSRLDFRVEP